MQTLDVISINLWQMLASLGNLALLFWIVKKFLYKPVMKMLAQRQATIEGDYEAARTAREQALSDKQAYEEKLSGARSEAERMIKSAADTATLREREILAGAKSRADGILRQAEADAALERRKAEEGIKREIVEVSSLLAEKLLEREVSQADHKRFIDSFIESIGDEDDADR